MKRGYEYFEHTADVGVRAYGETLEEVFVQAARGLTGIVCDIDAVRPVEVRAITAEAPDLESLLVAWLSEMLFYMDSEQLLFCEHEVSIEGGGAPHGTVGTHITAAPHGAAGWRLTATSRGERMDTSRHNLRGGIKAVTYHMLEIDAEKGIAQFLLDV